MPHDVRSVLPVQATLGEGPVWIGRDAALWFVDIKQRHVHRFDPATGTAHRWDAPEHVGWVLPAADGGRRTRREASSARPASAAAAGEVATDPAASSAAAAFTSMPAFNCPPIGAGGCDRCR